MRLPDELQPLEKTAKNDVVGEMPKSEWQNPFENVTDHQYKESDISEGSLMLHY
jgi:hypothetical protein